MARIFHNCPTGLFRITMLPRLDYVAAICRDAPESSDDEGPIGLNVGALQCKVAPLPAAGSRIDVQQVLKAGQLLPVQPRPHKMLLEARCESILASMATCLLPTSRPAEWLYSCFALRAVNEQRMHAGL